MGFDLKVYENQAKLSVSAAIVGGLAALGAAVIVLQAFHYDTFLVIYNPKSMRLFAIGGALGVALVGGAVGFFAGLNSAGQRRNKQSRLSWTGFFLSAAVLTIALSIGVFFALTRHGVVPGQK